MKSPTINILRKRINKNDTVVKPMIQRRSPSLLSSATVIKIKKTTVVFIENDIKNGQKNTKKTKKKNDKKQRNINNNHLLEKDIKIKEPAIKIRDENEKHKKTEQKQNIMHKQSTDINHKVKCLHISNNMKNKLNTNRYHRQ